MCAGDAALLFTGDTLAELQTVVMAVLSRTFSRGLTNEFHMAIEQKIFRPKSNEYHLLS